MNASRTTIKQSLKTVLEAVPGVKKVFANQFRDNAVFPAIVIQLEKTHEKVHTMGNPGRRHIHYTATLYIQSIDPTPDEQVSQQAFDVMLDAIDTALRNNKDLGGTVLASAWDFIDTDLFPPMKSGQGLALIMRAIKTFDVCVEIIA